MPYGRLACVCRPRYDLLELNSTAFEMVGMSEKPVIIHLHVPKCAGSSINRAIREHFHPRCTGLTRDAAVRERYLNMTPQQRDERFDAVFGHLKFGEHRLFTRPCVYISATRDPIDRICSFFNFLHTRPDHKDHDHIKSVLRDLNDFNEEHLVDETLRRSWADAFCRIYGGNVRAIEDNYEKVKRRILHQSRQLKLLAAPLPVIEEFLMQIGIIGLPRLNVTDSYSFEDFVPASPDTLDPSVHELLSNTFCRNDYDLLESLEIRRPYGGVEFAQQTGLGESWLV